MIVLFGLGTRLHVRMRTTLKMASLQQPQMAFTDQGEVEAMKTPIGRRAQRCDKD